MISRNTENLIPKYSQLVSAFFNRAADDDGVNLNPTVHDERTARLTGRIFEETRRDRIFIICLYDGTKIDAFVKLTGLNQNIDLLTIYIPPDQSLFPTAWDAYLAWLHKEVAPSKVLADLRS